MVVTEASSFSPLLLPLAAAHSSSCWLSLNAGWFAVVVMHIIIIMLVGVWWFVCGRRVHARHTCSQLMPLPPSSLLLPPLLPPPPLMTLRPLCFDVVVVFDRYDVVIKLLQAQQQQQCLLADAAPP